MRVLLCPITEGLEEQVCSMFLEQVQAIGTIRKLVSVLLNTIADSTNAISWLTAVHDFKFIRAIAGAVWGLPFNWSQDNSLRLLLLQYLSKMYPILHTAIPQRTQVLPRLLDAMVKTMLAFINENVKRNFHILRGC